MKQLAEQKHLKSKHQRLAIQRSRVGPNDSSVQVTLVDQFIVLSTFVCGTFQVDFRVKYVRLIYVWLFGGRTRGARKKVCARGGGRWNPFSRPNPPLSGLT